ncbi:MAG: conserved phage C-terminal domain-containing protein [Sulfurimonas sp.]|jgi:uncharacterized phage protein (TIGR02220 family)
MSKDPAFLFYSSDFLTGTMTMTDEQVGKYIRLLCLQHQKGILSENDMIFICKSDESIKSKFIKTNEGYFNKRLKEEAEKRANYCLSRGKNKEGKTLINKDKKHIKKKPKSYVLHMEDENVIINIIEYLNKATNKKFKADSKNAIKFIMARLEEKFSFEDFKKVIDNKCKDWLNDEKMNEYLRPETLFGTKFEGYLNKTIETSTKRELCR